MKKKIWLAVALAVVIIVSIVAVIALNKGSAEDDGSQEASRPSLVGNAIVGEGTVSVDDDWLNTPPEDVGEGYYVMNMWETTWRFKDGGSPSYDASITNDSQNTNPVYLELLLNGTEETLFVSDYIELGDSIHGIELARSLEKGEYDCTLVYHLMDQEKKEEVDTVRLAITVVIEN